jgi:hypothetical protein
MCMSIVQHTRRYLRTQHTWEPSPRRRSISHGKIMSCNARRNRSIALALYMSGDAPKRIPNQFARECSFSTYEEKKSIISCMRWSIMSVYIVTKDDELSRYIWIICHGSKFPYTIYIYKYAIVWFSSYFFHARDEARNALLGCTL